MSYTLTDEQIDFLKWKKEALGACPFSGMEMDTNGTCPVCGDEGKGTNEGM